MTAIYALPLDYNRSVINVKKVGCTTIALETGVSATYDA
jgi:hypothetical protein